MDDEQHRREEEERRNKRKASKAFKSDAQLEKERKQQEHRRNVLKKHGGTLSSSSKSPLAKQKEVTGSKFQELFNKRAEGFHIDFRFRNAPPRPPVGPTFVGHTLEAVLVDLCRQYKQHNAVEANYTWRLHTEPDLGVPLAPSAMDLRSYPGPELIKVGPQKVRLHEDDEALLNWTGGLGDTAGDRLKQRQQDRIRTEARAARAQRTKKEFSRVLEEGMQTWMKKTTYLSNDYSRKVHDFKSLAQTKQEIVQDLAAKQEELAKGRSTQAIEASFDLKNFPIIHPTKRNLQPKSVMQLLPNVEHWGEAYTHVVIDKPPTMPNRFKSKDIDHSFLAQVEKKYANSRMTCQLFLPIDAQEEVDNENKSDVDDDGDENIEPYQAALGFDLDVIPLKEEDKPHVHFCFWINKEKGEATYLPISSRVQLSSDFIVKNGGDRKIARRALTASEQEEVEELMAQVDLDLAEKHHIGSSYAPIDNDNKDSIANQSHKERNDDDGDDGEGDYGDDDGSSSSDDEGLFGSSRKTITAAS